TAIPRHRLHDVAYERKILRAARRNRIAGIDRPDHLIGARLDLVAFEHIRFLLVSGEVDDAAAVVLERLRDREEHGVAQTAAGEEDRFLGEHGGWRRGMRV